MYNTNNSVPSTALEDMADNAQVFDALVTKTEGTTIDRLGRTRRVFQQILMDMGFQPLGGSFQTGATITARNQTLYDEASKVFYAWGGALPKVVAAGSTPATAGGVGVGVWSDKTDLMLRSELTGGGSLGANYKTINVDLPPFNGDLDAAINSVTGHAVFLLGAKTYYSTLFSGASRNQKLGIKIIGSGVPVFDPVTKTLVEYTGTIIRGSIQNSAKGFECHNLGIDLGDYVRTTYRGGVYEDALVNYNFGSDAGIKYGNLIILESEAIDGRAETYTHCHLAEIGSGVEVTGNMEIIYGGHGYVVKCSDFNASGKTIKCYGQRLDSFIVKSDAAAKVRYARLGNVVCGKSGYTTRSGLIEAHTLNSTDAVYFDSLTGAYNEGLIQPSTGSTGYITDIHIGYLNNENSYGTYYNVIVPSLAVDWFIGKHQINNCSGGIEVQDGAANVFISDGIVKGSTVHGYKLGGTYKHGNIKADDNAGCGVYRTSGDGLNIEKLSGSNNTLQLYNSIPSALESLQNSWAQHTSNNFEVNVFGRKVRVSGRLKCSSATAGSAATIKIAYRPVKPRSILAHGLVSGGSVVPLWCEVTTDGRIEVDNHAVATGGFVDFFGEYDI